MSTKRLQSLASFRKQQLLVEFASLKHACPRGVYVSLTPGDPTLWSGVLFVRTGPYAPAILRFQISFPPKYPDLPPIVTFTTDIFHPLLTPLTTYTYTTGSSDTDPVSATDEERLPPGGFSLRHGFPHWFQRAKRSTANSAMSSRDVSGSQESYDQQSQLASGTRMRNPIPSVLGASSRASPSPAGRSPQIGAILGGTKNDVSMIEVLRYIRSAFAEDTALDSVPLESAGNPGAWHAWRAHRRQTRKQSPSSSPEGTPNEQLNDSDTEAATRAGHQRPAKNISTGRARQPSEWNWEGVWEERVRRGIEASQSEAVLYGNAGGRDDLIRFLDMDDDMIGTVKETMKRSVKEAAA